MAILTIHRGTQTHQITFEPGALLQPLLEAAGFALAQPCGGLGKCGKCAVMLTGQAAEPTPSEKKAGVRLSCQAVLLGDADVILPEDRPMMQVELSGSSDMQALNPMPGKYGSAIDIGTTTLALKLCDLSTGTVLASSAMLNPQTTVAADVIGRIGASMEGAGEKLRHQILTALETMLHQACANASVPAGEVSGLTIAGNTTMLYLLTGRRPDSLSRAPFEADCLFDEQLSLLSRQAYLPPCLHAFVGADISCAILASGMCDRNETALLCDVGTNGEIALWHGGKLYISSTAAGPAFEGAGIACGCGSIAGAIDRVEIQDGKLRCHTIGEADAVGICGSGLMDAVAALLELGVIDETGAMDDPTYPLRDGVYISQADIRAVQLAKAAIAAGVDCLLQAAKCREADVQVLYLCGGFGSHMNPKSVSAIGMLPEGLLSRLRVLGNGSLSGAQMLLMNQNERQKLRDMAACAQHVNLGGSLIFNNRYIDAMMFDA